MRRRLMLKSTSERPWIERSLTVVNNSSSSGRYGLTPTVLASDISEKATFVLTTIEGTFSATRLNYESPQLLNIPTPYSMPLTIEITRNPGTDTFIVAKNGSIINRSFQAGQNTSFGIWQHWVAAGEFSTPFTTYGTVKYR